MSSVTTISVGAKSRLAKLLASENITVEHRKVETAYFDVKNRILCLPMWKDMSEDVYDMLLVHETGHALHTPMGAWESAIKDHANPSKFKGFINVCEDARVDKKQKRKYPGARRSYAGAFKALREADFFGLDDRDPNSMGLIDRINLFHKGFSDVVKFSDEEMPLVDAVADAESFEAALAAAESIYDLMDAEAETDSDHPSEPEAGEPGEDGESGESEAPSGENDDSPNADTDGESASGDSDSGDDSSASGESDESDGDSGEEASSGGSDEDSDDSSNSPEPNGESTPSRGAGVGNDGPVSETAEAEAQSLSDMVDENADKVPVYTSFASDKAWILDNLIIDSEYIAEAIWEANSDIESIRSVADSRHAEFMSKNKAVVSYLAKEFEMRKAATARTGARTTRSGSLDVNRLHRYKWADDVFKRAIELPKGKNHGLVMYVDWSGSMGNVMDDTIDQIKVMALFCKRVGIPFEVYAFTDGAHAAPCNQGDGHGADGVRPPLFDLSECKSGDWVISNDRPFWLLNLLSSSVRQSKFNDHLKALGVLQMALNWETSAAVPGWLSLSGTPLNGALMSVSPVVNAFRAKYGLEIVHTIFLTDGEGYAPTYRYDPADPSANENGTVRVSHGWGYEVIVRDDVVKREWILRSWTGRVMTFDEATLESVKARTGSSVSNMYITGNKRSFTHDIVRAVKHTDSPIETGKPNEANFDPDAESAYGNMADTEIGKAWKTAKADGGVAYFPTIGWSSYFLMPCANMVIEDHTLDDKLVGAKKGAIKKAFGKASSGKVKNRVILRKFTEMLAV